VGFSVNSAGEIVNIADISDEENFVVLEQGDS
jgi:hypothetical protein